MRKYKNISNKKFGRLVAINRTDGFWNCKCICGNIKRVRYTDLRSGNTTSCGCFHKEMMSKTKSKNIAGQKFGKLTAIKKVGVSKDQKTLWECVCDCGVVKVLPCGKITTTTRSCGCLHKTPKSKHLKKHPLYETWCGIKKRCNNKNTKFYCDYGGRGIKVCKRWNQSFEYFLEDMGEKPDKSFSIDRIDNNKNYSCGHCEDCKINNYKANCRWADRKTQRLNKRSKEEVLNDRLQFNMQNKN